MQEHLNKYVKGEVNASARRVLFTQWVGQAWEEVSGNREMVICSFEKVGISVPVVGSGDHLINIGVEDYHVMDSDQDEDPFADSDEVTEEEYDDNSDTDDD